MEKKEEDQVNVELQWAGVSALEDWVSAGASTKKHNPKEGSLGEREHNFGITESWNQENMLLKAAKKQLVKIWNKSAWRSPAQRGKM